MKLRYLFILTFSLITIVPLLLFWMWPYSKALESELLDVKERHLVIAKNLAGAFERYYQDVTGVFSIVDDDLLNVKNNKKIKQLFESYGFYSLMVLEKKLDGNIERCLALSNKKCPSIIQQDLLELIKKTLNKNEIKVSIVTEDKTIKSGQILLVMKEIENKVILAYLSTEYIVGMGKRVAFGEKGHAAIVDQEGNVLSHPLDSWIEMKKNISKVSAVQKMIDGKTGVEKFFSPALKDYMIAGYTSVEGANWGVMVPQPIKELERKAKRIDETAIFVLFLGLSLALLITIPISFILIKPLEKLFQNIKDVEKGKEITKSKDKLSKFVPVEIRELINEFKNMINKIDENRKVISHLAYVDIHTKLPNRNYFHEVAIKSLDEMKIKEQNAALVFIDFDGFKQVNDTYGHRIGDELLEKFGERVIRYFSLWKNGKDKISFEFTTSPKIIPARLGGDEFVILFKNIKNEFEVKEKIEKLFKEIFSDYILYGGIKISLTGSAGISLFPQQGEEYSELLKLADIAMYSAKEDGKNAIRFAK